MFKRLFAFLITITLFFCLSGCGKKVAYQTTTLEYKNGDTVYASYSYTYTVDNKPAIITASFENSMVEDYIDVYSYNETGDIVSYSRKYENSIEEVYSAEKITNNKYLFKDDKGAEYLTIIFDNTGFIVSSRYANGYVTEYAYSYDKNGKPLTFKQLNITPSGSSRIIDYEINFTDSTSCQIKPVGEAAADGYYYTATYNIIK
ncbi:MAG: hypothetical protein E7568_02230 [Ruminococcaceae bacterium]|nr:hypothetical protein [Oscillospiraceae bacterium]